MNPIIELLQNHRSIRKFTSEKLTREEIETIIQSAQQAATSSYMMAYTIFGITDEKKKAELSEITGQSYVKENGHFLIFCADFHRVTEKATQEEYENMLDNLENSEHFLVSAIDASLAAQNAAVAAESMGLGICYIGSIRNQIARVDELLNLPRHVIPLFGMAIGHPAHKSEKKPRLPLDAVYMENEYKLDRDVLDKFDDQIQEYYARRSENSRQDTWTDQMKRRFQNTIRMDVTDHVRNKGFNKK
ncbi:oxygen-insensitive NADPH nitroreductase [Thalassobacillus pellis]|uniref:oxygen-insensitive NADPH nitroreductase n=1 Tax=Thalassobacillus pellis TaxID=748008 RepID=UPI00195FF62E|nr:oxygen-insensitive NADPH nitroreductase [Thalassobacillus pellis]MBM7553008.1 FMN reductase (NADPH) [Thalassobacillus pellis]